MRKNSFLFIWIPTQWIKSKHSEHEHHNCSANAFTFHKFTTIEYLIDHKTIHNIANCLRKKKEKLIKINIKIW